MRGTNRKRFLFTFGLREYACRSRGNPILFSLLVSISTKLKRAPSLKTQPPVPQESQKRGLLKSYLVLFKHDFGPFQSNYSGKLEEKEEQKRRAQLHLTEPNDLPGARALGWRREGLSFEAKRPAACGESRRVVAPLWAPRARRGLRFKRQNQIPPVYPKTDSRLFP